MKKGGFFASISYFVTLLLLSISLNILFDYKRCLPGEVFWARPTGRRPRGRPRTRWRDFVSRLAWERLRVRPEELEEVAGDRDVWVSLLKLLPLRPDPRRGGR